MHQDRLINNQPFPITFHASLASFDLYDIAMNCLIQHCVDAVASKVELEMEILSLDEPVNLRCLCRAHNQMMAREMLGPQWANAYKRRRAGISMDRDVPDDQTA